MEIIYIFTVIFLLVSTLLIKKSEKERNILLSITITTIVFTIYNILIAFLFSIIKIPCNLLVLSIANTIIASILTFLIIKKKEKQKYYIRIKDIVCLIVLLVVIISIGLTNYKVPMQIKYQTTDPAVHYEFAKDFYNTKTLKWDSNMPAAAVNTAILFDTFDFVVQEDSFYVLFILFDLGILFLIGAVFYLGIIAKIKSIKISIITFILGVIFLCGYPLNSVIFGYSYLTVGILYLVTLIVTAIEYKTKELNTVFLCFEMFFINFGLFFSYYFFVPVVYLALGLYMLFDMLKNRKNKKVLSIFTKENILKVIVILVVPSILGLIYFVLPGIIKNEGTALSAISSEGYIYRDLYSNFVLFAPLAIFYVLYNLKNKKNSFSTVLFIISSVFTLFLLKKGLKGEVSSYYYYKMYFLLWILVFYMNVKALLILDENKNTLFSYSFVAVIIGVLAIAITGYDYKISSINVLFNPTNSINSYANIFIFNKLKLEEEDNIYSEKQLNAIKYTLKQSDNKKNIKVNGKPLQMLWANAVWKITDTEDIRQLQNEEKLNLQEWLENKDKKYIIIFNDISQTLAENTEDYKTIYKEKDVVVFEKNNY